MASNTYVKMIKSKVGPLASEVRRNFDFHVEEIKLTRF